MGRAPKRRSHSSCTAWRTRIAGSTDPTKAPPGSIRGDLGRDWGQGSTQNIVHGSDSPESAEREIGIWFA